jgi:HSP20 family protein
MRGECSMSSQLPDNKNKRDKEPFGEILKSMNAFFTERPIKGLLESIDVFFKNPLPHLSFPVKLVETERDYIITAELPGIKREQIQINTLGTQLTISILNNEEQIESDESNLVYSRRHSIQKSSRSINLPVQINEKEVKAVYRDGLLKIRVPIKKGPSIQID